MKANSIMCAFFVTALIVGLMAVPSGAALANEGLEVDAGKLSVTVKDRATGLTVAQRTGMTARAPARDLPEIRM